MVGRDNLTRQDDFPILGAISAHHFRAGLAFSFILRSLVHCFCSLKATVDGRIPASQLIYRQSITLFTIQFFYIPGGVGFLNHQKYP